MRDLVQIVQHRVGRSIIDDKAIEFVARKEAATSGDARNVLGLVVSAIGQCRKQMTEDCLKSRNAKGNLVKMQHVMMAIRERNTKFTTVIEGLPLAQKAVLCVATGVARMEQDEMMTFGKLKRICMDAFGSDVYFNDLGDNEFKRLVESLVDTGLLFLAKADENRMHLENV